MQSVADTTGGIVLRGRVGRPAASVYDDIQGRVGFHHEQREILRWFVGVGVIALFAGRRRVDGLERPVPLTPRCPGRAGPSILSTPPRSDPKTRCVGPAEKAKASDHHALAVDASRNDEPFPSRPRDSAPRSPAASSPRRSRWRRSSLLATLVPRALGPADFGRFSVLLTIVTLGSLALTLGGPTLMARFVPAAPPHERVALARAIGARLTRGRAAQLVAIGLAAVVAAAGRPGTRAAARVRARVRCPRAERRHEPRAPARPRPRHHRPVDRPVSAAERGPDRRGAGALPARRNRGRRARDPAVGGGGRGVRGGRRARRCVRGPHPRSRFRPARSGSGSCRPRRRRSCSSRSAAACSRWRCSRARRRRPATPPLAIGIALGATYAVLQAFTVALPHLADHTRVSGGHEVAESTLRRLAGGAIALLAPRDGDSSRCSLDSLVPAVFGDSYRGATTAFGPALALLVLAPLSALHGAGVGAAPPARRRAGERHRRRRSPSSSWPSPPSRRGARPGGTAAAFAGAAVGALVSAAPAARARSARGSPPSRSSARPASWRCRSRVVTASSRRCRSSCPAATGPTRSPHACERSSSRRRRRTRSSSSTTPRVDARRGRVDGRALPTPRASSWPTGAGRPRRATAAPKRARAPVVCFTDDDCRPGPRWLDAIAQRIGRRGAWWRGRPGSSTATRSWPRRRPSPTTSPSRRSTRARRRVRFAPDEQPRVSAPTSSGRCRSTSASRSPRARTGSGAAASSSSASPSSSSPTAWVAHHPDLLAGAVLAPAGALRPGRLPVAPRSRAGRPVAAARLLHRAGACGFRATDRRRERSSSLAQFATAFGLARAALADRRDRPAPLSRAGASSGSPVRSLTSTPASAAAVAAMSSSRGGRDGVTGARRHRVRRAPTRRPRCGCPSDRCPTPWRRTVPNRSERTPSRFVDGRFGPPHDEVGEQVGAAPEPNRSATRSTDSTAGWPSRSVNVRTPSAISSMQGVGVLGRDDPVALAAPQVEPHVALVLGRVRERAGPAPVDARAARGAR